MKLLKFIKLHKIKFTVTAVIVGLIVLVKILDCGPCLQQQDYNFGDQLMYHLKEVGDTVKVIDIHPGDWEEVCVYGGGVDMNLKSHWPEEKPDRLVINDNYYFVTDKYNETAVVFNYGENPEGIEEIEIYRATPKMIAFMGGDCIPKDNAYAHFRIQNEYFTRVHFIAQK